MISSQVAQQPRRNLPQSSDLCTSAEFSSSDLCRCIGTSDLTTVVQFGASDDRNCAQVYVSEPQNRERSELEARKAMTGDSEEQWATTRLLPKRAELPLECPTASIRF